MVAKLIIKPEGFHTVVVSWQDVKNSPARGIFEVLQEHCTHRS